MEFEYWWLLAFPLFFGMGWLAARIDLRHLLSESRAMPERYFKGVKFLLENEPDKAIESFVEVVRENPQTADLNFALGVLFRRKGQLESAIRMHQGLLEREDIDAEDKLKARFELAVDFHKVGLFDRAEQHYVSLRGTPLEKRALKALLDVYQQQRNWNGAIAMARELADASATQQHEVAQFYCEMAQRESNHSRFIAAREYLELALSSYHSCTRARVMQGDIAAHEQQFAAAIDFWQMIELQDVNYMPLVGRRLLDAYVALDRLADGRQYLQGLFMANPQLDLLDIVVEAIDRAEGVAAATRFLSQSVIQRPSWPGVDKLLDARIANADEPLRSELAQIRLLLRDESRRQSLHNCRNCGFKAKNHYWHCPACGGWETFNPFRGSENPV